MLILEIYVDTLNGSQICINEVQMNIIKPFVMFPVDSSFLSLYTVSLDQESLSVTSRDISSKGILLPFEEKFLLSFSSFPLKFYCLFSSFFQ